MSNSTDSSRKARKIWNRESQNVHGRACRQAVKSYDTDEKLAFSDDDEFGPPNGNGKKAADGKKKKQPTQEAALQELLGDDDEDEDFQIKSEKDAISDESDDDRMLSQNGGLVEDDIDVAAFEGQGGLLTDESSSKKKGKAVPSKKRKSSPTVLKRNKYFSKTSRRNSDDEFVVDSDEENEWEDVGDLLTGTSGGDAATPSTNGDDNVNRNKPFACTFPNCNASFAKPIRLRWHLNVHNGARPFACTYVGCAKRYTRPYHLTRHAQSHLRQLVACKLPVRVGAEVNAKQFVQCEICQEPVLPANLRKHIERRHNKSRFACSDCPRVFNKHQHLLVHSYVHTKVPPFACPHASCTKRFLVPSKLKRHLSLHDGYKCSEAGCTALSFEKYSLLRKHQAHHRRQKARESQRLEKLLTNSEQDNFRMRKPESNDSATQDAGAVQQAFICDLCQKQFLSSRAVRSHWTKVHTSLEQKQEAQLFRCDVSSCGKKFCTPCTRGSLARHVKMFQHIPAAIAC